MFQRFTTPHDGDTSPHIITFLKRVVFLLSLTYSTLYSLYTGGILAFPPAALFNWGSTSFLGFLFKPWLVSLIIPYPTLSWSMIWDFFFLAIFYVPITSFVASYIGEKHFTIFWFLLAYIAAFSHGIAARILPISPEAILLPYSIFSNIACGMVVFWMLMIRTSKTPANAFFMIPIPLEWIALIPLFICIIIPLSHGATSHAVASVATALFSYAYAVTEWHMKSHISYLEKVEETLIDMSFRCRRIWHWHVMRHIRVIAHWIESLQNKK